MYLTYTIIRTAIIRNWKWIQIPLLIVGFVLWCEPVSAQVPGPNKEYYRVEPSSRIWVEGSTTVNKFSCVDNEIGGFGRLAGDSVPDQPVTDSTGADVEVRLNVHDLDCGRSRMNHDMYKAMKADSFPRITYHLLSARMLSVPENAEMHFKAKTIGTITLAGKSKVIDMDVDGILLSNGRFHVTGSHPLLMSDFDIQPPSPFFGLIKTKNKIVVHFDLFVRPSPAKPDLTNRTGS